MFLVAEFEEFVLAMKEFVKRASVAQRRRSLAVVHDFASAASVQGADAASSQAEGEEKAKGEEAEQEEEEGEEGEEGEEDEPEVSSIHTSVPVM